MFAREEYPELAGSLALVAIASLGGPVAMAGATLAEIVKQVQRRYKADAPSRELRRRVSDAITSWAANEQFSGLS